jgi:hypothetical protein
MAGKPPGALPINAEEAEFGLACQPKAAKMELSGIFRCNYQKQYHQLSLRLYFFPIVFLFPFTILFKVGY